MIKHNIIHFKAQMTDKWYPSSKHLSSQAAKMLSAAFQQFSASVELFKIRGGSDNNNNNNNNDITILNIQTLA